jgi:hypothetical protein
MLDDYQREVLQTLRCEYDQRREEIIHLYQRYDKQAQTLNVYLSIVGLLTLALMAIDMPNGTVAAPGITMQLPPRLRQYATGSAIVALTVGVLTALFFISNIMEILHIMALESARSAALERIINDAIGMQLLAWDSGLVDEFYTKRWRSGLFVGPSVLVGVWATAIFAVIITVLSFLCHILAPSQFWYWAIPVWLAALYHVLEWLWLVTTRRNKMFEVALSTIQPHRTQGR